MIKISKSFNKGYLNNLMVEIDLNKELDTKRKSQIFDLIYKAIDIIDLIDIQPSIHYTIHGNILFEFIHEINDINYNILQFTLYENGKIEMFLSSDIDENIKGGYYDIPMSTIHKWIHRFYEYKNIKKIFISCPMNGLTDDDVFGKRALAKSYLERKYPNCEFIGYIHEDAPDIKRPSLWYLSKSIEILGTADAAYFCDGWQNARGCVIEHEICEKYNIPIID